MTQQSFFLATAQRHVATWSTDLSPAVSTVEAPPTRERSPVGEVLWYVDNLNIEAKLVCALLGVADSEYRAQVLAGLEPCEPDDEGLAWTLGTVHRYLEGRARLLDPAALVYSRETVLAACDVLEQSSRLVPGVRLKVLDATNCVREKLACADADAQRRGRTDQAPPRACTS